MSLPIGDRVPRRGNALTRALGRGFLRVLGWRLEGEIPDLPKMVLIGAPHTTNWDGVLGLATLTALGLRSGTMIKACLFKGPMGFVLRAFGAIPIERDSRRGVVEQSIEAFARAPRLLLLIAPEGTRHGAVDWKRGFHRIAAGAAVPILPAAIDYPRRRIRFGPLLTPGTDYGADLALLLSFYAQHSAAKHPERTSKPLCDAMGRTWQPPTASGEGPPPDH